MFFLQPALGMSYDPASNTFTWTPPASSAGKTYNLKFFVATKSGGTDWVIVRIAVAQGGGKPVIRGETAGGTVSSNPSQGPFFAPSHAVAGLEAQLDVFDIRGRRVRRIVGPSGATLQWNGDDESGRAVRSGVYLYRMRVGQIATQGKWVLFR